MKNLFAFICLIMISFSINAQDNKIVQAEIKVSGNCGQCESRIEKAVKIEEVKSAMWDKNSKILKISFLSPAISVDSLQKRIAAVGHDTEKYKATKEVYSELPKCCLYRVNPKDNK